MRPRINKNFTLQLAILFALSSCGQLKKLWEVDGSGSSAVDYIKELERRKSEFPELNLNAATFADCSEMQTYVRKQLVKKVDGELLYYRASRAERATYDGSNSPRSANAPTASADMENSAAPSSAGKSHTNVQENGVDEGDYIKVGDHHLFAVSGPLLHVTDRQKLKYLGLLDLAGLGNIQLYTSGESLVVIGVRYEEATPQKEEPSSLAMTSQPDIMQYPRGQAQKTIVRTYALSAGSLPNLIKEKTFDGMFRHHRMLGQHLILTFDDTLPIQTLPSPWSGQIPEGKNAEELIQAEPVLLADSPTYKEMPCTGITKPQVEDFDFRITRVTSIDTVQDLEDQSLVVLGSGDHLYMTTNSIYLVKQGSMWHSFYEKPSRFDEILILSKIKINGDSGAIEFAAVGGAYGRVKDHWAMKEYPGQVLSVATSTGQLWDHGDNIAQNHLFMLREDEGKKTLETIGSVTDFGTGEDIRSVRYIDHLAYVVTFKKTDPLFAFDLSNPEQPKMLDELKIPGFSVYMHPAKDQRLIGVGFDAADQGDFALYQGIQVSLFDIADPTQLNRMDVKIHGGRGSYSEVTSDHHAFFYDEDSDLMALPVVEIGKAGTQDPSSWTIGHDVSFSGAVFYDLNANKLTEIARVSHNDLLPAACKNSQQYGRWWEDSGKSLDVNRIFKVDDHLLTLSQFGIKVHNPSDLNQTMATIAFKSAEKPCQSSMYP